MFRFKKKQKIVKIGDVMVGGQPGELPTVLVGSIFHEGHKIVRDRRLGIFDRKRALRLIRVQDEMSEKTGIPCMVDVVAEKSDVLIRYIDFVAEATEAPFLINGPSASVRIAAARHAVEVGLQDRAVYNSINYTLNEEEIKAIKEIGVKAAIVQAFNPRNPLPDGMISILEKLLDGVSRANVEKPLILTPVLDVPSIGFASEGIFMIKETFGLPAGTAPVGVIGRWKRILEYGLEVKRICRGGAIAVAQSMGADFIIYGSIAKAKTVFPVTAMVDAIIAYKARRFGIKPIVKNHPIYKML